ncbi:MAG: hypothetical protein GXP63_06450 [DPANN group archaeon]|nr:hypothetical protein [DPANN group archaeon]
MVTKKDAEKDNSFLNTLKGIVSSSIVKNMKERSEDLVHHAQEIAYQTAENMMEKLFSAVLFGAGVLFIMIAITLLVVQYLDLTLGWSFLLMGLLLLVISLLFKGHIRQKRYYRFKR